MNNNSWFKKERPILGVMGAGGGLSQQTPSGPAPSPGPISATGGTKTTPGDGYIYHLFTTPGTFEITAGDQPINCLMVGGGGGGGFDRGGGGGGGAFRPETLTGVVASHPVIVGYAGTQGNPGQPGNPGMPPTFNGNGAGGTGGDTVLVYDSTPYIAGGGGGGGSTGGQGNGMPGNYGGSGGGAAGNPGFSAGYVGGPGPGSTPYSPYGNPGKLRCHNASTPIYYVGGGGGGAGAGAAPTIPNYTNWQGPSPDQPNALRNASDGKTLPWIPTAFGHNGNFSGGGGGGGGVGAGTEAAAPRNQKAGAGSGASPTANQIEVIEHTGSGGGGGAGAGSYTPGEPGAKGVVLFRYEA